LEEGGRVEFPGVSSLKAVPDVPGVTSVSGHVLIVDDDAGTGRLLALLVRQLGHNAAFVDNGIKALAYLDTHHTDLVILDLMMPGIDGLEVLKQVRQNPQTADVPVIIFSALADPQFSQKALTSGATDYWIKASVDFHRLGERLEAYLPPDNPHN
jgi:CheY-like chemotaxis protein